MRRSDAAARDNEVECGAQAAGRLNDGVGIVGDGLDALEGLDGTVSLCIDTVGIEGTHDTVGETPFGHECRVCLCVSVLARMLPLAVDRQIDCAPRAVSSHINCLSMISFVLLASCSRCHIPSPPAPRPR